MQVAIRVQDKGISRHLCEFDLMQFSEEQVRQRMAERGLNDESFFVCGISDWDVDRIMSLKEAYLLRRCVELLYDGDSFIVSYLLKQGWQVSAIVSSYFVFVTKDELELMVHLLQGVDLDQIVAFWFKTNNWVNALNQYILAGRVLNTSRGFYCRLE